MEILSILTGAFVAGCDLGIKKYTEENVRDGEERRIWKGKGIYRKVHNKGLMMNHLDSRPKLVKGMSAAALGIRHIRLTGGESCFSGISFFGKNRDANWQSLEHR